MIKSSLKNFYKKKILIIITIVITSSIILSSLSSFFIQKRSLPILTVNQEKIYPEVLKLIYKIIKKKQNKTIKEIFLKIISKEEYKKYIFQQIIIDVINESLLKEYIKDINFYISKKNIKKIIYSSKNFKKKKKINYKKYLKFINYIQYTHNEYINSLQKKISVKYLIKLLSKSIILLKKEIHNKLKKIIERKNIQVIHFNTKLNKLEKKKNKSKIKKYFLLNKKKFYYPESCIIKIIHLKKKKKISNIKNNFINFYLKNINKKKKYKKYKILQTNSLKNAKFLLNKLKEQKKKKKSYKFNNLNKNFNLISLGWINKKKVPNYIKKLKLKKNKDYSKIIFYKKNFFIFFLDSIYKSKLNKNNIKNTKIIKKIKNNNYFFEKKFFKQPINNTIKIKNKKLENLFIKKNIKIFKTKPINYQNIMKHKYLKNLRMYIKKNFFYKKSIQNNSKIHIYKKKNNDIYLLQIHSYTSKKLQNKKTIYKKILNILNLKEKNKKNYLKIKDFFLTPMNQKKKFLQKNSVYLYNSQTLSRQNYEEIMQILNNLPPIKKNHYIYLLYKQKNKKYELIIIKKEFFKKIEKNEKKTIIKNIKKYLKTKTINNILNSLYKKSKIILNFNQTK